MLPTIQKLHTDRAGLSEIALGVYYPNRYVLERLIRTL